MASRRLPPSHKAASAKASRPKPRVVDRILGAIAKKISGFELPAVEKISESQKQDPFQILISALLSARTQDATTLAASTRLFAVADTPEKLSKLPLKRMERLIYPVSFYRNKAVFVRDLSRILLKRHGGRVPNTIAELTALPGVGRKTANLVRISNRLGWVRTRTPEQTEQALYQAIQRRWWPLINLYLVSWGQNTCRPVYPRCQACVISNVCPSATRFLRSR
jgi:endonuclease-3